MYYDKYFHASKILVAQGRIWTGWNSLTGDLRFLCSKLLYERLLDLCSIFRKFYPKLKVIHDQEQKRIRVPA